jgi:hypothetical protein
MDHRPLPTVLPDVRLFGRISVQRPERHAPVEVPARFAALTDRDRAPGPCLLEPGQAHVSVQRFLPLVRQLWPRQSPSQHWSSLSHCSLSGMQVEGSSAAASWFRSGHSPQSSASPHPSSCWPQPRSAQDSGVHAAVVACDSNDVALVQGTPLHCPSQQNSPAEKQQVLPQGMTASVREQIGRWLSI